MALYKKTLKIVILGDSGYVRTVQTRTQHHAATTQNMFVSAVIAWDSNYPLDVERREKGT